MPFEINIAEQLKDLRSVLDPATSEVVFIAGPSGRSSYVALRDGYELHQVDGPSEGTVAHTFHDVESFADWLNRASEIDEVNPVDVDILLDMDRAAVTANLEPKHIDPNRVVLKMRQHHRSARWLAVLNKPLQQKAFQRLVLTCIEDFADLEDKDGNYIGSQAEDIAAQIAKLEVIKDGKYSSTLDARGHVTLRSASESENVSSRLPTSFVVQVPWYIAVKNKLATPDNPEPAPVEPTYAMTLWIELDISGPAPTYTLTCPGLEGIKYDAVQDVARYLRRSLDGEFLVGLGEHRHGTRTVAP